MPYWVTRFTSGSDLSVTLPTAQPSDQFDEGESLSGLLDLPRGDAFDSLGADEARPEPRFVVVERLIAESTAGGMRNTYDCLAAMKGRKGTLTRTPDGTSSTSQTISARCLSVITERKTPRNQYALPVTMTWQIWEPVWDGGKYSEILTLTGTTTTSTLPHLGNGLVRDIEILYTVPALDVAADAFWLSHSVAGHTCHLYYASSIGVGEQVTIDVGSKSVTKDGVDTWDALDITATHKCPEWFRLAPSGVSDLVTITRSGGGGGNLLTFSYKGAWK